MGSEVMEEGCLSIPHVPTDGKRPMTTGNAIMEEGCLSVPHVLVEIRRPKTVWVEFTDQDNCQVRAQLSGLVARIFQHEYDHLPVHQNRLLSSYRLIYQLHACLE